MSLSLPSRTWERNSSVCSTKISVGGPPNLSCEEILEKGLKVKEYELRKKNFARNGSFGFGITEAWMALMDGWLVVSLRNWRAVFFPEPVHRIQYVVKRKYVLSTGIFPNLLSWLMGDPKSSREYLLFIQKVRCNKQSCLEDGTDFEQFFSFWRLTFPAMSTQFQSPPKRHWIFAVA